MMEQCFCGGSDVFHGGLSVCKRRWSWDPAAEKVAQARWLSLAGEHDSGGWRNGDGGVVVVIYMRCCSPIACGVVGSFRWIYHRKSCYRRVR